MNILGVPMYAKDATISFMFYLRKMLVYFVVELVENMQKSLLMTTQLLILLATKG